MDENNKNGSYVITEQGDLGLGTYAINENYVNKDIGKVETPEFDQNPKK